MDWKPEYSLGIPDLDKDHRILVQLLTRIEESVAAGLKGAPMLSLIEQLINMSRAHFDDEVTAMRLEGYPAVEDHVSAHQQFLAQIKELEIRTFGGAAWTQTLSFLRTWLDQHLSDSDKRYASFVRQGYK